MIQATVAVDLQNKRTYHAFMKQLDGRADDTAHGI